jgi:hypothetical protein
MTCRALLLTLALFGACAGGTAGTQSSSQATWQSALLPDGALHDFSYAGYRNGGSPLPANAHATLFEVVADPSGQIDATAAVQSAIDLAEQAGGGVVHIGAGLFRCDGQLRVSASGIVLRGDGSDRTRLHFTKHEGMTDRSHIEFRGAVTRGTEYRLAADGETRGFEVELEDAADLVAGTEVSLGWWITPEFIADHGMTGTWQAFNGSWQPFERRTIVAIDGDRVRLDVPLRAVAKVRDRASLRVETGYLSDVGVEDIGVANAVEWDDAWAQLRVHAISMDGVKDAWIRNVHSFATPGRDHWHLQNGGIMVLRSKRVTVADSRMENAQNRGGGGCGYLFEIRQSSEVLTRDCEGFAGRHNFIQNWGFGVTGCVWLRCHTARGLAVFSSGFPFLGSLGFSEFHHSLATANLIDSGVVDDGWAATNRGLYSTGAGHAATECVFWNVTGKGIVRSQQFGVGYVIGTGPDITLVTTPTDVSGTETAPEDLVEGAGSAADLEPQSLYLWQFARRAGIDLDASGG